MTADPPSPHRRRAAVSAIVPHHQRRAPLRVEACWELFKATPHPTLSPTEAERVSTHVLPLGCIGRRHNVNRTTILLLEDNPDLLREFECAVAQLGPPYRLRCWRDLSRETGGGSVEGGFWRGHTQPGGVETPPDLMCRHRACAATEPEFTCSRHQDHRLHPHRHLWDRHQDHPHGGLRQASGRPCHPAPCLHTTPQSPEVECSPVVPSGRP